MKRFLALLLALVLTCGCLAGVAFAADGDMPDAGVILENGEIRYRLVEDAADVDIEMDAVPLAMPPHMCCALHFVLMLCALTVAVYFTHDRKLRQTRIYEMRLANMK